MKYYIIVFFIFFTFTGCSFAQPSKGMKKRANYLLHLEEITAKDVHPTAARLMQEDFYWDIMEESTPFGNDAGSGALYAFLQWRPSHPDASVAVWLKQNISRSGFPELELATTDSATVARYVGAAKSVDMEQVRVMAKQMMPYYEEEARRQGKPFNEEQEIAEMIKIMEQTALQMGYTYLKAIDDDIIGTGFAQLVLEGHMEAEVKMLVIAALQRECWPMLLERWPTEYQTKRSTQYRMMLAVIERL